MGVTCDVGKAFVIVNLGLYSIDKQSAAIRGIPHKWFQSYPQVREKAYQLGTYPLWECFEYRSVTADIPQGSILEPFKSNQNIFYSIKLQYT